MCCFFLDVDILSLVAILLTTILFSNVVVCRHFGLTAFPKDNQFGCEAKNYCVVGIHVEIVHGHSCFVPAHLLGFVSVVFHVHFPLLVHGNNTVCFIRFLCLAGKLQLDLQL